MGSRPRDPRRVVVGSLVTDGTLRQALQAENAELKEDSDVGGEPCHQILITLGPTRQTVLYVSKKDWLPRRMDMLYKNEAGEAGTTELVITNLKVYTKLDPAPFRLKVPEGYTKTDDFAP
jgi:outer membrane lipoprotein-sorting protein